MQQNVENFIRCCCETFHILWLISCECDTWDRTVRREAVWCCCRRVMRSQFLIIECTQWPTKASRFVLIRLHRFMMGFNQRQAERRQTQNEFFILCFPSDKFVIGHRLQDVVLFSFEIALREKLFSFGKPSLNWCIARDLKGKQTSENAFQTFIYQSNQILYQRTFFLRWWK